MPEERLKSVFLQALERVPAVRSSFLEEACKDNPKLHLEAEALLRAHDRAGNFLRMTPSLSVPEAGMAGATEPSERSASATVTITEGAFALATATCMRSFGDYELLKEIAHGGMGVVYSARQISLNRPVALKMILSGQFASETEVKRFNTEAEAAANLNHPNIVGIYAIGVHQGQHYFSMPYIQGRSLAQIAVGEPWAGGAGREAARLVAKVARAVQYAHERGVLHRDLKPANILIDSQGEPHVLDFGLARRIGADSSLTLEGAVLGTPSFMAPEQAAGKTRELSAAADIYALGAILYFLLTGRPPFVATSPLDTLVQVLEGEVVVPRLINGRVARDLEQICLRCLEKAPQRRYGGAGDLAEDLERFVRDEPVEARPPNFRALLLLWVRRQPALVSRLVGLGICLIIAHVTFPHRPKVSLAQHTEIVSTLLVWGLLSGICQWALERNRWRKSVPFLWAGVDVMCLTVVLWLDEAMPGPLIASFPVLVALSGLWFQPMVVVATTLLSMLGYCFLVFDDFTRRDPVAQVNWHIAFLVFLVLAGAAVAYQAHRVQALSRFYDRRF